MVRPAAEEEEWGQEEEEGTALFIHTKNNNK